MPEWDECNRPVGYILSVTPGFASFGQGDEQLMYMGLARKTQKAARLGFEFAEIDFESLSEMFEPDIEKQVKHIKRSQGLEVGLHLPVDMDLTLAYAYQWKHMHEQLVYGAVAGAEKLKSKFILFHTSSNPRPALISELGEYERPADLVAWDGTNLGEFIEENDMKDWFIAKFMEVMFSARGMAVDPTMATYFDRKAVEDGKYFEEATNDAEEGWQKILSAHEKEIRRVLKGRVREESKSLYEGMSKSEIEQRKTKIADEIAIERGIQPRSSAWERIRDNITKERIVEHITNERMVQSGFNRSVKDMPLRAESVHESIRDVLEKRPSKGYFEDLLTEYRTLRDIYNYVRSTNINEIFDYWKRHGSSAEERVAYHVVAKWMYNNNMDIWTSIVESKKDPDEIIYRAENLPRGAKEQKTRLIDVIKQIITAVSGQYLKGHLTKVGGGKGVPITDGRFDENSKNFISGLNYCRNNKVHIFIETNQPGELGQGAPPGELRIIKATDHVKIVKSIDPESLSYCMDFEHLLTNYVDPEQEAENLKKNKNGKYVRCLHINAPRPIKGAHGPVESLSHDMYILYRYLKTLRDAGVENAYWVWEMGSYGVKQSAIAFRKLREELMKGTDPKDLPPEFFGIDKDFEARQMHAIKEHAYKPLKGLLMVPEEEHGILSRTALEKNRLRQWEREKYK